MPHPYQILIFNIVYTDIDVVHNRGVMINYADGRLSDTSLNKKMTWHIWTKAYKYIISFEFYLML